MFLPLAYIVFLYIYYLNEKKIRNKVLYFSFLSVCLGAILLVGAVPFIKRLAVVPYTIPKIIVLLVVTVLLTWCFIKIKDARFVIFISILLLARIGFNWFVVTDRYREGNDEVRRKGPVEIGRFTKMEKLYIFEDAKIHNMESFYITRERMKILERKYENFNDGAYYLIQNDSISNSGKYTYAYEKDFGPLKLVKFN